MSRPHAAQARLVEHVQRLGEQHPPIPLESVDFSVRDPRLLDQRFGHVLDFMARVELEVDRNVLELLTLLPDPPEVDVFFYRDVWQPQEIQHGRILDELQVRLGRSYAETDLENVGFKLRLLGMLSHVPAVQDVSRMLYYLTGMATERSAVLAYNLLHDGLVDMGEQAIAETVIVPIKRQEPGHYAFYQLSARALWEQLAAWQKWLVRTLRSFSFSPVGVNNPEQLADFGDVMTTLGIADDTQFVAQVARVETELLWAREHGLPVPDYVLSAFRGAVDAARARAGLAA
ncbi:GTP-binding protein LepA [Nocardioides sp. GY 10127]|uniref:GTP-binding protein LepA n=1 Tax=Nocardioides sp. GY 10127 TaxID=2569762 RepID=UPI0010A8192B|nr:GTP-binding protein LepA [Nocardioides sp. GY 10127]TIC82738.1 GTP-binding protein LepA [Nocardioides sp. GY 10127]